MLTISGDCVQIFRNFACEIGASEAKSLAALGMTKFQDGQLYLIHRLQNNDYLVYVLWEESFNIQS
jgi:hypothetical protein